MAATFALDDKPSLGPSKFRPIHLARLLKPIALDFVATLFFAGLYALTGNLLVSIVVGVAAGAGQVAWRLATRRPIAAMQWAGLGLVILTGAIALVTKSPLVVMLKPTLIYAVIGLAMLQPGWMRRYAIPMERSPIPMIAFVIAGYFIAALVLVGGALNLYFALGANPKSWAMFISIYPITSKLVGSALVFGGFALVGRHNGRRGIFFPETSTPAAAKL
jgi:intracellular septation protein A